MKGPVFQFFADDHRRLDSLFRDAAAASDRVDLQPFGLFRAGLLRHIGMEEKLLFPALRDARTGSPWPTAAKLRVDHGAIAALLVPTPTPAILDQIRSILVPHNRREEEPGGAYEHCDNVLGTTAAEQLVERASSYPDVPLNPYADGPEVVKIIEVNLERSRRQWIDAAGRGR